MVIAFRLKVLRSLSKLKFHRFMTSGQIALSGDQSLKASLSLVK